ncbi:YihY family inner membrane protein [Sphingobacterium sp. DK4209]|uniref:YihY family inner membrane protein n=1 Tax=Sphingobacterium zhuxiongii TaxID=2662364 RepID=A0A5Q0QHD4_9SPHI|nr:MULTISPECIES: YihY/virulence factor BrkB family protein [unclassified Sphingobacterium]MVZ67533.1 YihY family inner membrane protein [Sphingobacterium sp. DK4209]QGA27182.1 YihY family inner membrane protein [Sphingobacterium sp. dk4302]
MINTIWTKLKEFWELLVNAVNGFIEDNCMKLSASLAYYTVFSIGPLLLILTWTLGFFYGEHLDGTVGARDQVMDELSDLFGREIAATLESTVSKISLDSKSNIGIIIGTATLMFTSTTIFVDIQNSINTIWKVKPKPKKGWLKLIINRLISFSMILGLVFLLMASLIVSSLIGIMTDYFNRFIQNWDISLIDMVNTTITFVVITTLFGIIYAFLPDAKVRFKDILGGAIFTSLLFMLGKYGISVYLSQNMTASSYGAAGSIIILLAWVYYSSAILYFGAEFTKEYAIKYGKGIQPSSFAVLVKQTELEIDPETGIREVVKKHNDPVQ